MSIFQLNGDNTTDNATENQGQPQNKSFGVDVGSVTNPTGQAPENKDAVEPQGENPTVILDGPLSRIYTQALNLVLANEDTSTMLSIIEAEGRNRPDFQENNAQRATYVYADSADALNTEGCVAIVDFISKHKDKGNIVLSLESLGSPSRHMSLVEQTAKENGVKIHYSRGRALEAIRVSAFDKKA